MLIAWRTGKPCPTKLKKPERLARFLEVKDQLVKPAVEWTEQEEAEIKALEEKTDGDIELSNTQCARDQELATNKTKSLNKVLPEDEMHSFSQTLVAGLPPHPTEDLGLSLDLEDTTEDLTETERCDDLL